MDRELLHLRDSLVPRYAEMIYYGFWYAPERETLQVLMDHAQRDVTGTVRLKLYKGNVTVTGRRSPRSLYRQDVVTFEADSVYRQKDAEGFIRLNALRLRIRALRDPDRAAEPR
jgi:argininosuccinate synthase